MYRCTAVYRSAAAIAHGFWAHIMSPPRIDKPPFSRWGGDRLELLVTFVVCCRTASDSSTAAWLNPLSLGLKIDQSQKMSNSDSTASDFRDTSTPLNGRRVSLAQGQW